MILHNMIVRMQQHGEFYNEAAEMDIVTGFCEAEEAAARQSRTELDQNITMVASETLDDVEE